MTCKTVPQHRLLFLTVNSSYSHSSLALPLLHSACYDLEQWQWMRCDVTNGSDLMSTVRYINSCRCDLLATDLYLFNRQTAMEILQRCHVLDPACRIVVGGPECLGEGAVELMQMYPFLDRVFRGEGEAVFRDYLEHFDDPGIARNVVVPAEDNALYQAWAASPPPAADEFFAWDKPFVQIETSRGCPMQCFYCTSGGTVSRYRSLEQVRSELQQLHKAGVKEVRVLDRTFNLPQERGAALLRMFREEFPDMRFHLELHPQFLNDSLRKELLQAQAGQLHVEVGIQCLDQEVQTRSGRCSDVEKALEGLEFLCKRSAFETHADLLAGLPGQRWQHIIADAGKLMQLDTAEIQLEILKALPGTPLRKIAAEYGIIYSPLPPYDVMQSNTVSMQELQYARDLSRLLDLTYNHKALHPAVLAMHRSCPEFVARLLEFFHQANGDCTAVWDLKKRFLFLLDFCQQYQLADAQQVLAYQWLLAGYPQQQGPDIYSTKTDHIPPAAQCCSGNAACQNERESRFWIFPLDGKTYFLAYNRAYALNRPAAIWVADQD